MSLLKSSLQMNLRELQAQIHLSQKIWWSIINWREIWDVRRALQSSVNWKE